MRRTGTFNSTANTPFQSRTTGGLLNYNFRLGAYRIPQTPIDCSPTSYVSAGIQSEARMELHKALNNLALASLPSALSQAIYSVNTAGDTAVGGFVIGCNMQAFSQSPALSDGRSTRAEYLMFEATFNNNPNLTIDFFLVSDKILTVERGLMSFEE